MVLLKRDGFKEYRILVEAKDLERSRFGGVPLSLLGSIIEHRVKGVKKVEFNSGLVIVTINPTVRQGGKLVQRGPIACENRIQAALEC
jgi:hypothetical protein